MAEVELKDVDKVYEGNVHAVQDLSLEIADGEFLVLVGPSGCGKTTALRMVAGLETISDGTITIGERVVNDLSPKDRDIAMVFQSYALYPHLSVADNIAFGLQLRKMPKAEIDKRVAWAAKLLDLTPYLDRKPKELSGGQRQRVAMGRAIVREPQVFLMDEPLSNLDAKLRVQMRAEIAKLQQELGDDHDLRHARPGRGDDDGRPRRRDEHGAAAAGRHAAAALRRAGEPLRRELHRHAADEPARGGGRDVERRRSSRRRSARRPAAASARSRCERYPGARGAATGTTVVVGHPRRGRAPGTTGARPARRSHARLELVEALGSGQMAYFCDRREVGARRGHTRRGRGRRRGSRSSRGPRPNLIGALPAAVRPADRRRRPGRDRHRQPPLLRRGDRCGAPLGRARSPARSPVAALRPGRGGGALGAPRRAPPPPPPAGASSRCSRSPRRVTPFAVAARLLRDDRPLRERRSRRTTVAARRAAARVTGFDPVEHRAGTTAATSKGLTGTCDDPRDGPAADQGRSASPRSGSRRAVGQQDGAGPTAPPTTATGASTSPTSTRTSAPRPTSARSSTARTGSGMKVLPRRRRQPHRRRDPPRPAAAASSGPTRRPVPRLPGKPFVARALRGRHDVPVPVGEEHAAAARSCSRPTARRRSPAWLNDVTAATTTAATSTSPRCSAACFEQGDFFGLDDLFTEQPAVVQRPGAGVRRLDPPLRGRRLPRRHREARRPRRSSGWVPKIRALPPGGRGAGLRGLRRGLRHRRDRALLATSRDARRPEPARLPAAGLARPLRGRARPARRGSQARLADDDYFRGAVGVARRPPPRSSATTTSGASARMITRPGRGASDAELLQRVTARPRASSTCCAARRSSTYGDEVGMIGRGGDKAARQDMFPTQVPDVAGRGAGRLAADRDGLVVRRRRAPGRRAPARRSRSCATSTLPSRPGRRPSATRSSRGSWSPVSTGRPAASTWRRSTPARLRSR